MAAPMAKIKQVFKVEMLNLQQEATIKSPLYLFKLNNRYTYWYYLSHREYDNCKKARIFITFHNNTCWSRHVGLKSVPPKQKSNTHTYHVISLGRKKSKRSCIFDWKQANITQRTHGWWKRESMRITCGLPTMRSHGQRSNWWSLYKYCQRNIFWPLCLKIVKLSSVDASWEWMFPIDVLVTWSKVKVKLLSAVYSISYGSTYESRSNYQLQIREMEHLKKLSLILPSNQADKTLNSI